jgi:molybdopterin/thiamine biosynthesis adenylyltransferase
MEKKRQGKMARKGAKTLMNNKNKNDALDFDRIEHLLNPAKLHDKRITVVGLGSGGAPVCDHLTMSGVRLWHLYDPDTLEPVNLVKHPRMRKELGKPKVEIQKNWITDRNPTAEVETFTQDIMESDNFIDSIRNSHLVLSCPDKKSVREYVNDKCIEAGVPFVTASVFRTGIGGEIFTYIPGETGCYRCLQYFTMSNDMNLTDRDLGLTEEEKHKIYGLDERNFAASGLSIDIQMIALIQARMALSLLLKGEKNSAVNRLKSNWIIFGNRPAKGIFRKHFEVMQMLLRPQEDCNCTAAN